MTTQPTIAFIGLGHMGGHMAANLVAAGYTVHGFDLMPAALDTAASKGVTIAESGVAAAAQADIVLTMLPAGAHVLSAYPTLLAAAKPGTLFLDCSTIEVDHALQAAEMAQKAGFEAVDAPVSGGMVGAEAGTLTFMVGGSEAGLERVRPLLEVMGKKVVHCGANSTGQAAKICNNMLLGIAMIGASEAFALGQKLGLENQVLYDVISTSSGYCWAVNVNCPVPGPVPTSPANKDYEPGFATALMAKDMGLALAALETAGINGELGKRAAAIYAELVEEGRGGKDFSDVYNRIAGTA
ncbi:3-hydroxyisobutyrate dehydrogenase [Rothia endophytica]|uniref:3-hydroxyisobutyrate dehydrogenase n=1 Tax=Rothia endophytica TaxID=1324766 RepID=UPI001F009174|nr:3-hydroxyisobutyrate dehydrogenase [Rothia endophytica]